MRYFCLPDNMIKLLPKGFDNWPEPGTLTHQEFNDFESALSNQPAIHHDGKDFKPGEVVDGSEIEVGYQELRTNNAGDWIDTTKEIYDLLKHNPKGRRLFATRKSEAGKGEVFVIYSPELEKSINELVEVVLWDISDKRLRKRLSDALWIFSAQLVKYISLTSTPKQ